MNTAPSGLEGLPSAFARELRSWLQRESGAEHERVLPSQKRVEWGTVWISGHSGSPLGRHVQWGLVLPFERIMRGRLDAGDSVEELRRHRDRLLQRYDFGWRLSMVNCECDWRYGQTIISVHRSHVWPIRIEEYNRAKEAHFCRRRYYDKKWFASLMDRTLQEQDQEKELGR